MHSREEFPRHIKTIASQGPAAVQAAVHQVRLGRRLAPVVGRMLEEGLRGTAPDASTRPWATAARRRALSARDRRSYRLLMRMCRMRAPEPTRTRVGSRSSAPRLKPRFTWAG